MAYFGGMKHSGITTVGDLIEALKDFPKDAPIECNMDDTVAVQSWHTGSPRGNLSYVEIYGDD